MHVEHSPVRCRALASLAAMVLMVNAPRALSAADAAVVFDGTVPADWPADLETPVSILCPPKLNVKDISAIAVTVKPDAKRTIVPATFERGSEAAGEPSRLWFMWNAPESARGQRVQVAVLSADAVDSDGSRPANAYTSEYQDPQVHLRTPKGEPILSYWHGRPASGQRYPLTSFIHPLIGLDGEVLTWLSPRDHIHHRGIFWAWVRHELDGKPIGSWWQPDTIHLKPGKLVTTDSPVLSYMSAQHDWVYQPKDATEGRSFIDERVVCRTFRTTAEGRALDIDITLTALAEGVRVGGTTELNKGYGGFTFRYGAPTNRTASKAAIVMDGQETPNDLLTVHAKWGDWSGIFNMPDGKPAGQRSGASVFVDPSHPEYPPEWLTRYYGVLNVSYPDLKMIDIPKDRPLRLKYRVWIHRGDVKTGRAEDQYRAYTADFKWKAAETG